jgi:hypothetical protein
MLRLNRGRWWALAATSVVLGVLAAGTGAASLLDTAPANTTRQGSENPDAVPTGYTRQQPGAPITISGRTSTTRYLFESVRVRNAAESPISSITLVAGIEGAEVRKPIVLVAGQPIAVALEPGGSAELKANLLPPSQALALREQLGAREVRAMLGVLHVAFAGGSEWRVLPKTGARTFDEAFYMPKGGVVASHVEKGEARGDNTGDQICSDDVGLPYSPGGIVAVTDQPGALARCMHGRWIAYDFAPPKK